MDTAPLVHDLLRPEAYGHDVPRVGFLQTHISQLFFAGERVFKVKKAVDLGFLDFTTLERRRHFCEEEVRLNRRLAPDVYLGVTPIVRGPDGHLWVGGDGEAVEWAVEMVRLPRHRMLDQMLERGEIDNAKIRSLVELLLPFHGQAATGAGVDEFGAPGAIRTNLEQNFEQIRPWVVGPEGLGGGAPAVLTETQYAFTRARALAFLDTKRELFERRVRDGRIREGHGDLHTENVCFGPAGVVAYDCIEFNPRFRCGDVASDLAFLAMDLDERGFPAFSKYLVKRYVDASGDSELPALVDFYKSYRAIVRTKVAALAAADRKRRREEREHHRREAMRYAQLAASYGLPPALILMCGLPATGKTWLGRHLARPLRAIVLHSDVRRKAQAGMALTARGGEDYGTGMYSDAAKDSTYRSLLEDALTHLRAGHSVVVDATFSRRRFRSPFVDAVVRMDLPYYVVHVGASESVVRARLVTRAEDPHAVSDADLAVYRSEVAAFEPPQEVPNGHVLEVVSGQGAPEERSGLLIDRMIALRSG